MDRCPSRHVRFRPSAAFVGTFAVEMVVSTTNVATLGGVRLVASATAPRLASLARCWPDRWRSGGAVLALAVGLDEAVNIGRSQIESFKLFHLKNNKRNWFGNNNLKVQTIFFGPTDSRFSPMLPFPSQGLEQYVRRNISYI